MVSRFVELPGRGTTFVREVSGPPHAPALLLLHGLAATALLNWGPSMPSLGRGFHVIALDHRGHGRGLSSQKVFSLEDCADDAVALLDELGVDRAIVAGYSMGGLVAQLVWKRHPERVAGLVLCATAARFASERQRQVASAIAPLLSVAARVAPSSLWREAGARMVERQVGDSHLRDLIKEEIEGSSPPALVAAAAALAEFDSSDWIGGVASPSAVILTTQDRHVAPKQQLALAKAMRGCTLHRVEADHYACVARADLFVPKFYDACQSVAIRS